MSDLWDDLPIEMLGDRPLLQSVVNKQVAKPTEVERIEKGRDAQDMSNQGFGATESK